MFRSVEKLKEIARKLQPASDETTTDPWMTHVKNFHKFFIEGDLDNFLREAIIISTMFVGNTPAIDIEYKYLVENHHWDSTWKSAIKDSGIGNPMRYTYNSETSGNRIHCAYHLAQFEERMNYRVKDMDFILEIGAGYGCMTDVCFGAGFRGKYYLFDLPIFSLLQEFYLGTLKESEAYYISDVSELEKIIPTDKSMVISTWALSEFPTSYRDRLLLYCLNYRHLLFAYQLEFGGMDIRKYFEMFRETHTEYSWQNYKIKHMHDNHEYMFGSNFYE